MAPPLSGETGVIDHLGLNVGDINRSRAFYDAALAPLQIGVVKEVPGEATGTGKPYVGYGKTLDSRDVQAGKPSFWIAELQPLGNRIHIAFIAEDRGQVDAFHAAALAAGGTDNGAPGLRPHYHP